MNVKYIRNVDLTDDGERMLDEIMDVLSSYEVKLDIDQHRFFLELRGWESGVSLTNNFKFIS